MMTYIGCEEARGKGGEEGRESEREREKPVGGWERFLPHIKVFTRLCVCLLPGRGGGGGGGQKARGARTTLGWREKTYECV